MGPPDSATVRTDLARVVGAASIITVAFMGSVVVSPLYPLYQRELGFSDVTLTLVYAVYAVGNVTALLVFGQVSDQVGRKRAALPGLAVAAAGGVSFLFAQGTAWLFVGRLLVGLAVGICSGTGTAWLAELYGEEGRATATVAAATANLVGIALGPLLGGLLAQLAPAPLVLPLVCYLVAVALAAVAAARTAETRGVAAPRRLHVRPRIRVPRRTLPAFAAPAITAFVVFALAGLYFALVPGILARDLHRDSPALSGSVIAELALVAIVVMWLGRGLRPSAAMRAGLVCLLPAVVAVVLAQALASLPLLLLASALAGVTLATGYRGSLAVVNQIAPEEHRAEVASAYFIACFVGNSVPVIGVGVVSTTTSPLTASVCFGIVVAVLALAALLRRPDA